MEFEHNLVYFVQLTAYMYCNRRLCSQLAMRLSYYSCMWAVIYTVSQKNWTLLHLSITLANTVRF